MAGGLFRGLVCAACACLLMSCGDDGGGGGGDDDLGTGNDGGAGHGGSSSAGSGGRSGAGGAAGTSAPTDGGGGGSGAAPSDAGPDAFPPPFVDVLVFADASVQDAGPPPSDWSCPEALWADGICDCGCSATDHDCGQVASCVTPGCVADTCGACFSAEGTWKPCVEYDPADWTCEASRLGDAFCDCGCGIPDPACQGNGCTHPGCHAAGHCDRRHGCGSGVTSDADDCQIPPSVLNGSTWECGNGAYGSGDGCDCGCGAIDPDCGGMGCTAARCFDAACTTCHDEQGRPHACAAAEAGWDDDTLEAGGGQPSLCNAVHFGADDGCDCGCGGRDPDCGDQGCDEPGCLDAACVRCVDGSSLQPTGCAPPTWTDTNGCDSDDYGTGNGCDCGCGVPDPDCGAAGCTTPGCGTLLDGDMGCEVCNDGAGFYVECHGWTCEDDQAMATSDCDCGCGVVDPACRDFERSSCTEPGCETAVCQYCNGSNGDRAACGGQWNDAYCGSPSSQAYYGLDGLCDCGCGASDPDCEQGAGCSEPNCAAPGCEVCHTATRIAACPLWNCPPEAYADGDACDCGCGAPDPDCGNQGCTAPGCSDSEFACDVCHDPYGRAVDCP